ncbi:MAG: hypothetical protein IIW08_11495 [Clostridia bacterium]|nr:hypothetical protein [Clostridia bacterium]
MKNRIRLAFVKAKDRLGQVYSCPKDQRALRLNHDTNLLKIIACLCMFSDHAGKMLFSSAGFQQFLYLRQTGEWAFLFPAGNIMRIIGRIAMPLFAYGIAVGAAYSRNVWKYALRMLIMGILVHPLYMTAMGHVKMGAFDWVNNFYRLDLIYDFFYANKGNIFFTLAAGAFILGAVRAKSPWLLVAFALLAWIYQGKFDYGIKGVLLICLFYAFLDKPLVSFTAVFLFMWYWGMPNYFTRGLTNTNLQLYAVLSLPLIYLPIRKRRVRLPKWVFYGFYPAHLIIIYLLVKYPGPIQYLERMISK